MALYLHLRFLFSFHRSFEPPAERIGGENIGNQMLKVMRENKLNFNYLRRGGEGWVITYYEDGGGRVGDYIL